MAKRNYSDREKAETLAMLDANAGNLSKTFRDTSVPVSTIKMWNDGRINPDIAEIRNEKKEELHNIFENIAYNLTGALDANRISEMSGQQLMTSAAIAVDKMRLLREQSTNITDTQDATQRAKNLYANLTADGDGKFSHESAIEEVKARFKNVDISKLEGIQQLDGVN